MFQKFILMALRYIKSKPFEGIVKLFLCFAPFRTVQPFVRSAHFENQTNCSLHAIDEYPEWFTDRPPRYDFIFYCSLITIYLFLAIAIVCDEYCVPSVERICYKFGLSYDVAGATVMALATSCPEFFINLYATFLTEGDMGVGTIVGSSVFNILAITACCCLYTGVDFSIDWWPISRDLLWYGGSVALLTIMLWDGFIYWWEAFILVILYIFNVTNLLLDRKCQEVVRNKERPCKLKCFVPLGEVKDFDSMEDPDNQEQPFDFNQWPQESPWKKFVWFLSYPLEGLFFLSIPNVRRACSHGSSCLSLLMSILWVSFLTYLCSWSITVIGYHLFIPDSVMGLVILAAGTSIPEAISSVIVTKKGYGSMAVCNAVGSNTVDILMCLGGPWLVKSLYFPTSSIRLAVSIISDGLVYTSACLLISALLLYISFMATRFQLGRSKSKLILLTRLSLISVVLCLFYIRFLFMATPSTDLPAVNENSFDSLRIGHKYQQGNCSKPAILEFPSDGFSPEQRRHGWIILHIVLMFYGFWFLAAICDDYLIPSIEQICSNFHIDRDVIGATVMAAAVSSPELFMNCIGTFITKGDIGVGTIVGSAVFNVLAVPACCGLFVASYLKLDWWPITRDCLIYLVSVIALLVILRDGRVFWYEALALIIAYFVYMLIMYHNQKMSRQAKDLLRRCGYYRPQYTEVTEFTALLSHRHESKFSLATEAYQHIEQGGIYSSHMMLYLEYQEREESIASPWSCEERAFVEFFFRWPITFLLWLTVPNSRKHHSLKYLTLILSIIWIAGISYLVAFVITIIGDTLHIPDAVMGLTILAAGMSIPEAVSSIIVTKQGQGSMGISNSLGSNTFDILLSLGLPWFIKSFFLPDIADQKLLLLNSANLMYAGILLLTSLLCLYLVFIWNKFTLNWCVGVSCMIMYIGFMALYVLVELNVFFPVNLPMCRH
ncbi:Sodium/potassium/calcium exchanger 5 [Lucilia cuprina]|nr:Sodium/potassium/calcium exchanger 5 [Lucilia cuprina]